MVLTAAHCADSKGLYYSYDELHEYTGVVPAASGIWCSSDLECPSVTIEGVPTQMKCKEDNSGPQPKGSCYLDDESLVYTNFALEAAFGETYQPWGEEHPVNAVPIQYCKVYDHVGGGMGVDPNDFAYCILAQEPDVEPIPIIMHCEVDEFLDGSYTLDVAAVGFGSGE